MKLFKLPEPVQVECSAEIWALAQRDNLLDASRTVAQIKTADQNQTAAAYGQAMRKHLNAVEKDRKEITLPYLEAQRTIKRVADEYCLPLTKELHRLESLSVSYVSEQERIAEAERKARAEEIARLAAAEAKQRQAAIEAEKKGDMTTSLIAEMVADQVLITSQAIISTPEPEREKVAGQSFTEKVLGWECTDPIALWNARPDLCKPPEPKGSAIHVSCSPERPVPGLKLWWKSRVTFKTR